MKTSPLLKLVVDAVEDIKGLDVKVLDVAALTTITDHMVVCTGTSNRHVKSIADNVITKAKESGRRPLGIEGLDAGEWVLVDLGDVVLHAMQAQTRLFYQLEKLWDVPPPEVAAAAKTAKPKKTKSKDKSGRARGKSSRKPGGKPRGKPAKGRARKR
ncbi:MAG TPA: ribosome silencing factor [Verrucomicrobiae bacterium]|nr:ribosome silencing factor [Verrucomicrobiae bacterium]